jgi:hypothetical protein
MSAYVFCLRPALPARGFWSFHEPAMIGRHAGGPSEDLGEIVKQFRLLLQLRLEATREVRDTIVSGKAGPLGELGQSGLCVAAAQPGCDVQFGKRGQGKAVIPNIDVQFGLP